MESKKGLQLFLYLIEQISNNGWTFLGNFEVGSRLIEDDELYMYFNFLSILFFFKFRYSENSELFIFTSNETDIMNIQEMENPNQENTN